VQGGSQRGGVTECINGCKGHHKGHFVASFKEIKHNRNTGAFLADGGDGKG